MAQRRRLINPRVGLVIFLMVVVILVIVRLFVKRGPQLPIQAEKPLAEESQCYFIVERPLDPGAVTSPTVLKKHEFQPSQNEFEAQQYQKYKEVHGALLVEKDEEAYGQIVATEIPPGQPLIKTDLRGPLSQVSVGEQVEQEKVAFVLSPPNNQDFPLVSAGFLKPHDQVDVIGVFNDRYAAILVEDVRVVAVGSDRGGGAPPPEKPAKEEKKDGQEAPPPPPPKPLTLALTQGEAEQLAAAVAACSKVDVALHGMRPLLAGLPDFDGRPRLKGGHSVDEMAPLSLRDPESDAKLREMEARRKHEEEDRKDQKRMQELTRKRQELDLAQARRAARQDQLPPMPPPVSPQPIVEPPPRPELEGVLQEIRGEIRQTRQEVGQVRAQVADLDAVPRGSPPSPPPARQIEVITGATKQAVTY